MLTLTRISRKTSAVFLTTGYISVKQGFKLSSSITQGILYLKYMNIIRNIVQIIIIYFFKISKKIYKKKFRLNNELNIPESLD